MNKKWLVLMTAVTSLLLVPTAGFASEAKSPLSMQELRSTSGIGDITIQKLYFDESSYLDYEGETESTFNYEVKDGSTIRYWLLDEDKVGMTVKIYDASNKVVATGQTSSSNNWRVLSTFTPASKDQTYLVRVVSNTGGGDEPYELSVRAY